MPRLAGKVAIITGAGSGLGQATAVLFALEGAKVVAADLSAEAAGHTVHRITDEGGEAIAVQMDVSKSADAEWLARTTVEQFGRIDILVNNAGIRGMGSVVDLEESQWDSILGVNAKGAFLCSKFVIPHMQRQGGGSIVCVSSISGVIAQAGQAAYNASKHAVIGLARCMAVDHAAEGIRVNVVCPGMMNTPMLADVPPAERAFYASRNLLKRPAEPIEVASAILYLASDESSFTTASLLFADGGETST